MGPLGPPHTQMIFHLSLSVEQEPVTPKTPSARELIAEGSGEHRKSPTPKEKLVE
jgi:hypothetical protein